jgi:two-component system sensor histidine kinase YesM
MLIENDQKKNLQLTEQIAKKINEDTLRFVFSVSKVINDDDIIPSLNQWELAQGRLIKFNLAGQIDKKLSYYFNYSTDLTGIYFIYKNNNYYSYKSPLPNEVAELKKMPWYQEMIKKKESIKILGRIKNSRFTQNQFNGQYSISIAALTNNSAFLSPNEVEMVYFVFKEDTYDNIYSRLGLTNVGSLDLVAPDGNLITSNNSAFGNIFKETSLFRNDYGWFRYRRNKSDILITYYTVPITKWKVVNSIPYRQLTDKLHWVMVVIIIVFIAVTILFLILFFTSVMGTVILPITNLVKQMKKVESGNFQTNVVIRGQDEVALLNRSFDNMVKEIQNLIQKIDAEKSEKLQLEIKTLQYQINPHFLFNTLNTITMMAEMHGVNNIKKMTDALTKLLLNTLDKGGMFTTLEKEFDTLEGYSYIMKLRYGDRFDIFTHYDEEIKNAMILKLLLQPIVENSILHGMSDVFDKLLIHIEAKQANQRLMITISDNGVGMTPEQIASVLREKESQENTYNRIGLFNVHQRIRLNHGDNYGLTITSTLKQGTTVILQLPVISASKE